MITYKNQVKLSDSEADQKHNNRRLELIPYIEKFIANDDLFKNKDVIIEFSHTGISSLVVFIEVGREKFVLKTPLSSYGYEGEAQFLRAWEGVGIHVPHVFREGKFGASSFTLMNFIEAPTLPDALESGLIKGDVSLELGKILRKMHTSKAEGYGVVVDSKAEFKTFAEWLLSEKVQKRINSVKENGLLDDRHGSISKAQDVLIKYVESKSSSSYCHFDFGSYNILATKPLTVIDPNPIFNDGIIDIGRSLLLAVSGGFAEGVGSLKKGYFEGEELDAQALQASLILNAYWKVANWHKKGKTKHIQLVQEYLEQTSNLL